MADSCVNARRTRRITARQSHLPKIRDDRKSVDRHEQIGRNIRELLVVQFIGGRGPFRLTVVRLLTRPAPIPDRSRSASPTAAGRGDADRIAIVPI